MNYMINRNHVLLLVALVLFPYLTLMLADIDTDRGLIWFMIHQLYYLPLSWFGEPLFQPDSEVGFFVNNLGRVVIVFVYPILFLFAIFLKRKLFASKYS